MSAELLEIARAWPEVAEAEVAGGMLWLAPWPLAHRGAALLESVWRSTFDGIFARPSSDDTNLHEAVWGDSYTGSPIPRAQIRDWVARTVANVVALRPRRVLEVGCGDGQIMRGLLPHCVSYVGTDLSEAAVAGLAASLSPAEAARVELACLGALDVGRVAGTFDTIVVNSVCQYFPSQEYFATFLQALDPLLAPGGHLYLGDLRSLRARVELAASIEWTRAPGATVDEWQAATRRRLVNEKELLLDPAVAVSLVERWGQASVALKRGSDRNELVDFRFDLVVRREPPAAPGTLVTDDWQNTPSLAALQDRLLGETADWVVITSVPNARLTNRVSRLGHLARAPGHVRIGDLPAPEVSGVQPEALHALANAVGRRAVVGPSARPGCADVFFAGPSAPTLAICGLAPSSSVASLSSIPNFGRLAARLRQRLEQPLRDAPHLRLPVQVLEFLPRHPDGGLDLAAARTAWTAA